MLLETVRKVLSISELHYAVESWYCIHYSCIPEVVLLGLNK